MGTPVDPDPVKLFVAALWSEREALDESARRMAKLWSEVDYEGPDHSFDVTDYYVPEMGEGLQRRLLSFTELVSPERIAEAKLAANEIEDALCGPGGRRVNLDVGYLDIHKVVLASVKYGPQKVYLGRGVYADIVCRYSRGIFHPFEWSFPDFRDGRYQEELAAIRARYKIQLRTP